MLGGNGHFGIGSITPTEKLHVKGGVRFEDLPAGSGDRLVIDGSGKIYREVPLRAQQNTSKHFSISNELMEIEIDELKDHIEMLESNLKHIVFYF